jgi:hypothetical protein
MSASKEVNENTVSSNTGTEELNEDKSIVEENDSVEESIEETEEVEDYSFINPLDGKIEIDSEHPWILENFLEIGNTVLIRADSGVGLTWLLSALSLGVARRTVVADDKKKTEARELVFSHFRTVHPVDVTFCDGSLSSKMVAERLIALKDKELNYDCKINLLCRNGKDISFYDERTRFGLEDTLKGENNKMFVFDSLSTLFGKDEESQEKPDEAPSFRVLDWLKELRNRNVTLVFVAPEGSDRDKLRLPSSFIDLEIKVSKVPNYLATEMRVEFIKSRVLDAKNTIPFRLALESQGKDIGRVSLVYKDDPNFYICKVHELSQQGMPQTKIARELGCNQSTVSRWLSKTLPERPRIR